MSAIVLTRFHLRPGSDRATLRERAIDFCRLQASLPGRLDARYYWSNKDTVVVLTEVAAPDVLPGEDAFLAAARAGGAISDVAFQTDFEVWEEARQSA
jgi:hypothetical protein